MIIATERHSSIKGLIQYYRDEEVLRHGSELIDITFGNISGRDSEEISSELENIISIRPETKDPFITFVLSLTEYDKCDIRTWDQIIRDFFIEMGVSSEKHPWLAVRHRNTSYDHFHLDVCRVAFNGELWNPKMEAVNAALAATKLEVKYGLEEITHMASKCPVTGKLEFNKPEKRLPTKEMKAEFGGGMTHLEYIQDAIDETLNRSLKVTHNRFVKMLKKSFNIIAKLVRHSSQHTILGYRFNCADSSFTGSDLGTNYTYSSLKTRGLVMISKLKNKSHRLSNNKLNAPPKRNSAPLSKANKQTSIQPQKATILQKPIEANELRAALLQSKTHEKKVRREKDSAEKRYIMLAYRKCEVFSKTIDGKSVVDWKALDIAIIEKILKTGAYTKRQIKRAIDKYSPLAKGLDNIPNAKYADGIIHEAEKNLNRVSKTLPGLEPPM